MILLVKGYVAFILHAHLPYVHHPEHDDFLEERWLFEAISETYIPLIDIFETLHNEGVEYKVTMSLTPPLLAMLSDETLQKKYTRHIEKLIELSQKEIERTSGHPEFNRLAVMYKNKYTNDLYIFRDICRCNIVDAFRRLQDSGNLEIIASAATHGFLPLLGTTPEIIRAQIAVGVQTYAKYFGRKARGMWLPECGYTNSLDPILKENGIEYIITESHGLLYASPRPIYGTYAPIVTPDGIVAFGRDIESSKQVWSSAEGYPGDFDYRDFYRDIGYDLDFESIKDYITPDGKRINTGIKYHRITGKTDEKQPYNPEWAKSKADMHAGNFMFNREKQIEHLSGSMNRPPIIVCPYDAELFGHWWFEGPYWLYSLFKKTCRDQKTYALTTLSEYIAQNPVMQVSTPCASTWGHRGYNEVWLNSANDWIYRHLHKAGERMVELADGYPLADGLERDALNQAARELLLAQSSDWAFIMKTGTMVEYAQKRTKDHISRFTRLYHDIRENNIDESWLRDIEYKDSIFPDIDYRIYKSR